MFTSAACWASKDSNSFLASSTCEQIGLMQCRFRTNLKCVAQHVLQLLGERLRFFFHTSTLSMVCRLGLPLDHTSNPRATQADRKSTAAATRWNRSRSMLLVWSPL